MLISEPVTSLSSGFEYVFKIEIEVFSKSQGKPCGEVSCLASACHSTPLVPPGGEPGCLRAGQAAGLSSLFKRREIRASVWEGFLKEHLPFHLSFLFSGK